MSYVKSKKSEKNRLDKFIFEKNMSKEKAFILLYFSRCARPKILLSSASKSYEFA